MFARTPMPLKGSIKCPKNDIYKETGFRSSDDMSDPRRPVFVVWYRCLDMGYERVELIDTTKGLFMRPGEAMQLCLSGSTLLVGKK